MEHKKYLHMLWERLYPYIIGVISAVLFFFYSSALENNNVEYTLDFKELISSIFDITSFFTGLLFTIYIIALTPTGSFIEKIFKTETFLIFRRYVQEAMTLGTIATLLTWGLRVCKDVPINGNNFWVAFLSVWIFFSISSFLSFFRVVYIFFILVRIKP